MLKYCFCKLLCLHASQVATCLEHMTHVWDMSGTLAEPHEHYLCRLAFAWLLWHQFLGPLSRGYWEPGQDFKFQVSRHHYLNLPVVPSMKFLSFIQLIRDREKVYAINCNVNKCHWHSSMRKHLGRAPETWRAICQPFPSTTWMHQNYIHGQDIFVRKIYLWAKYIYEQIISMGNIYI